SHERFVIHRDIKPANIILDEAERPFLADFGLARLNEGSELTKDQDILGSLRYMSPEQFESNHQVDFRSDIYSLGITLYEMLAGRPAVQNSNLAVVCQQVREGRIESPRSVNSSIELDLETIVLKAMSPEPELRYASAAEFRDDLDRYLNVLPVHAKPPTLSLMVSRWIRRNRKWVTALGIVVASLSLVIFAIAIFTSIRASNDEKKIRSASAKLWENAGIEKLSDGRALLSVADFEQAISLASNEVESQTHQQRIDGVDAWSAKLVESKEYQGRLLASSGANEVTVELQDGVSTCILHGDNIRKELFSTDRIVRKAAFSSDGNWCAILTGDRTNLDPEIRIYNRISEDLYLVSEKLDWRVTHLFFLEDNRTLFFTGWNGTAELWDVIDQKRVRSEVYETGSKKGWVFAAARDTSREKMVAVAFPGKLVGYELPELKPLWDPIDLGSWKTETLQLSKFGKWIVAGTVEKGVRLWHVDTGQEVRLPNRPNSRPTAATFSADETKLAVADHFGNIILWELSDSDGAEATRIGMAMQHGLAVQSLRFNDRLHLASASSNEIKIWRIEDSREITSSIPVKNGVGSFQWVDSDHLVISTRGNSGVMTQKWQLPQHLSLELKGDGELAELIKRNGKVFVSTCVKQDLRNGKIASINTDFNKEGRPTGLKNQIAFRSAVQHFSLSEDGLSAFVVEENDGVSTVARYAFPSMELNSVPVKLEYAPRTIDFETHGSYWATSDIQNNIIVRSFDDGKVLL
ncbi:MAG: WD40 repeat domain-containing serine/threonine protein kinase, partial [Planctomycetota bacterium]